MILDPNTKASDTVPPDTEREFDLETDPEQSDRLDVIILDDDGEID